MTLLAIDPGAKYTGYAVLSAEQVLMASGTMILRPGLTLMERHLCMLARLQDLILRCQPGVLCHEEFLTFAQPIEERMSLFERSITYRLIGGIQALALMPPYPVLLSLQPGRWGPQLTGKTPCTKTDIAEAVNAHLGTTFVADFHGNHRVDACGMALVAWQTYVATQGSHRRPGSLLARNREASLRARLLAKHASTTERQS